MMVMKSPDAEGGGTVRCKGCALQWEAPAGFYWGLRFGLFFVKTNGDDGDGDDGDGGDDHDGDPHGDDDDDEIPRRQ